MRLLIVEDDPHIAEVLIEGLGEDGFECDHAASAAEGGELARLFPYGLLLLDVMLPEGIDAGYRLGRSLREGGLSTPILYLTARGAVEDRVQGLESGGDDYLTKPFAFVELRARVRALLRRAGGSAGNSLPLPLGWTIDLAAREVHQGGRRAELTRREYAVLELFALNAGRAFERAEIIERLWAGEQGVEPKVIDVYVSTLRRKTSEGVIETVRGTGYRLGRQGKHLNVLRATLDRVSLRLKLTLGYALIFSVTALVFALGVFLVARSELRASLDSSLRDTARAAQANIWTNAGRTGFTPTFRPNRETYVELLDFQGHLLDSAGSREEGFRPPFVARTGLYDLAERRVDVTRLPAAYLRVSRPSDLLTEVLETLGRVMLFSALLLILVACLAGYWLADRALRPVDVVARTAGRIARQGVYHERVPTAPGQDEMARLTLTVNEMLDRLEGTIEREKSFARTAAHELRTPLTALKGRLELALERPREAADYRRSLSSMLRRVEDLIGLSEALLALARTEAPVQLERVELAALALEAAEQLGPDAPIHLDVEESWVQAEAAGVRQVVVNLLDNALKHGRRPLTLTVRAGELRVKDAGPGPPREEWVRLLRPFERGPGQQGVPGSGLGLALVVALAGRWGAQVQPEWAEKGFAIRVVW